jgi:putative FmdB family regulatory protein
MPIYEYKCQKCRRVLSFLVRSISTHKPPTCPKCGHPSMERRFSLFAAHAVGGDKSKKLSANQREADPVPVGGSAESGMDFGGEQGGALPAGAEGQMGDMPDLPGLDGLDENDPKSMGRWMRKMANEMGEKLDPEMDEVVRRLESGEDPDKIEEKMGDAMGGAGDEGGGDDALYDG